MKKILNTVAWGIFILAWIYGIASCFYGSYAFLILLVILTAIGLGARRKKRKVKDG